MHHRTDMCKEVWQAVTAVITRAVIFGALTITHGKTKMTVSFSMKMKTTSYSRSIQIITQRADIQVKNMNVVPTGYAPFTDMSMQAVSRASWKQPIRRKQVE